MTFTVENAHQCRRKFPALSRQVDGQPAVFLDGPAGTQVPQRVIEAVSNYMAHNNANSHGSFVTSFESDAMLDKAHRAMADLLGAESSATVFTGGNMTSLTFALSRALARTWQAGDEVIVSRLDHDANVTPWVLAARDAGATVKYIDFNKEDCTLDYEDFQRKLSEKTVLVAVGCASNATGSINPVKKICDAAREVNALSFLDAVHFAPHALIDVEAIGCDFLACSAYKFFGPHVGIVYGRRQLLEELEAYKLRPAPNSLPGKWMTGTQNHASIAGVLAAIDYIADIGRSTAQDDSLHRRAAIAAAMRSIGEYERGLCKQMLEGLEAIDGVRVYGIASTGSMQDRLPTISFTHKNMPPEEIASVLGEHGIFVWHGNYYAIQVTEFLGLEPAGMVRLGLTHYNTPAEVDRVLEEIRQL